MLRFRVIAVCVFVAIGGLVAAQSALQRPTKPAPRKPNTPPAANEPAQVDMPKAHEGTAGDRPKRPPHANHRPTPAASEAAAPQPADNESAPASQEAPRRPKLPLPASRPAREPQVVEFEIASSEGEPWGRILIELYPGRTPVTARTFVQYVNSGFYDGTIFHRIIPGFIVQGGGYTSLTEKKTEGLGDAIRNESRRGTLRNARGMVAMARKQDPHSAVSQFFINLSDNEQLDYPRARAYGYCVFGKVIEGMDVVDRIAEVETRVSDAAQRRYERYMQEGRPVEKAEQSEPLSPPILKRARLLDQSELPASILATPANRRAQPAVEPRPQTRPATEGEEQSTEESGTEEPALEPAEVEPGVEPGFAPESAPANDGDESEVEPGEVEPGDSTGEDGGGRVHPKRSVPKRAVRSKT